MSDTLDYSKLKNTDEVESEVLKCKDTIYRKTKLLSSIKDQKKDANAAYNEQIKEIQEEIQAELDAVEALNQRSKDLKVKDLLDKQKGE